jgi:hypothetical protein
MQLVNAPIILRKGLGEGVVSTRPETLEFPQPEQARVCKVGNNPFNGRLAQRMQLVVSFVLVVEDFGRRYVGSDPRARLEIQPLIRRRWLLRLVKRSSICVLE